MTQQLYDYTVSFDWNKTLQSDSAYFLNSVPSIDEAALKNEVAAALYQEAEKAFIEKVVSTGHYFEFGGVTTNVATYNRKLVLSSAWPQQLYKVRVEMQGSTTLTFKCDVEDYKAHNSPQLLAAVSLMIITIAGAIAAHAALFLGILLVIAFAVVLWQISNVTTGVKDIIEKGGMIFLIIAVVAAVIIAVLLFSAYTGKSLKGAIGIGKTARARK